MRLWRRDVPTIAYTLPWHPESITIKIGWNERATHPVDLLWESARGHLVRGAMPRMDFFQLTHISGIHSVFLRCIPLIVVHALMIYNTVKCWIPPIPDPSPAGGKGSNTFVFSNGIQDGATFLSPPPLAGGGLGRGEKRCSFKQGRYSNLDARHKLIY